MRRSSFDPSLNIGLPIVVAVISIAVAAAPSPTNAQSILDYFSDSADEKPAKKVKPKKKAPAARAKPRKKTKKTNTKPRAIGVIGGAPNSTSLQVVHDLSLTIGEDAKLRILPIVGRGAKQNIDDLLRQESIDLAITQSDVLAARLKQSPGKKRKRKIAFISTLYNSELHVIASTAVTRLSDLNGLPVNFGEEGSGAQFMARNVLDGLGIAPVELNLGHADAMQKLASGEIAATMIVAGRPTPALAKLRSNTRLHILSVPYDPVFHETYLPTKLTTADYPDLIGSNEKIDTLAVSTVLIAKNYKQRTRPYRRLATFVEHFFANLKQLQQPPRHSKWQETNLAANLTGWERFKPAAVWLEKEATAIAQKQKTQQRVTPERARALALKLAPKNQTEQERLFNLFTGKEPKHP